MYKLNLKHCVKLIVIAPVPFCTYFFKLSFFYFHFFYPRYSKHSTLKRTNYWHVVLYKTVFLATKATEWGLAVS